MAVETEVGADALSVKIARMVLLAAALVGAAAFTPSPTREASGQEKLALTKDIDGAISPASVRQLKEGLATAVARNVEVVAGRAEAVLTSCWINGS